MKKGHTGEAPRWWIEDGVAKCNVVGISWHKRDKTWQVNWQNDDGKMQSTVKKGFEEAVSVLLSKPSDGNAGPGEPAVHEALVRFLIKPTWALDSCDSSICVSNTQER